MKALSVGGISPFFIASDSMLPKIIHHLSGLSSPESFIVRVKFFRTETERNLIIARKTFQIIVKTILTWDKYIFNVNFMLQKDPQEPSRTHGKGLFFVGQACPCALVTVRRTKR